MFGIYTLVLRPLKICGKELYSLLYMLILIEIILTLQFTCQSLIMAVVSDYLNVNFYVM
jgi:hypothetical protein